MRGFKIKIPRFCKKCGKEIGLDKRNSELCRTCSCLMRRKFEIPKEELKKLVWEKPTSIIAKYFGVTDKAIQKRCDLFEIKKPGRGYWAKQTGENKKITVFIWGHSSKEEQLAVN